METPSTPTLFLLLVLLIFLSGFFSGSETAMMALNKYKLRHLVRKGHWRAGVAARLLERPDRLIGVILLGNNFVNIAASSVATLITLRLVGESGIAIATGLLTLVILIFSELTPKTLSATYPERLAFFAAPILQPLLVVLYPIVVVTNVIANGLLRLLGFKRPSDSETSLSEEELRTVILEGGQLISDRRQRMLLNIFELSRVTVEDVMIPRNEMRMIDIEWDWQTILKQFRASPHTRLPVYRGDPDQIIGVIHGKDLLRAEVELETGLASIESLIREPYFVPATTPLQEQLFKFQRRGQHLGLVVDEYGDLIGLVTLEDILEEIVGEIQDEHDLPRRGIRPQRDGSILVDGQIEVRTLNYLLGWELETEGPRTLAGLIIESLEQIPQGRTALKLNGHVIEVVKVRRQAITVVKLFPSPAELARIKEMGFEGNAESS